MDNFTYAEKENREQTKVALTVATPATRTPFRTPLAASQKPGLALTPASHDKLPCPIIVQINC